MTQHGKWILGSGLLALLLAGCGGGSDNGAPAPQANAGGRPLAGAEGGGPGGGGGRGGGPGGAGGGASDAAGGGGGGAPGAAGGAGAGGAEGGGGGAGAGGPGAGGAGGAGAGGAGGAGNAAAGPDLFNKKASWTFTAPADGAELCYDFDAAAEVAGCTGNAWDMKVTGGQRGLQVGTNSGPNGEGQGGTYAGARSAFLDWSELQTWKAGTRFPAGDQVPARLYFPDVAQSAFRGTNQINSAAFEYGLKGENDHLLYPSYRVFLITTNHENDSTTGTPDAPVFALQLTGYYGGDTGTVSGHPSFRWVDRANPGAAPRTATVDATKGWVYFDLVSGTPSSESGTWHIAFNRYQVRVNGGVSGSGKGGSVVGVTPSSLYSDNGSKPVVDALTAAKPEQYESYLTSSELPATATWTVDRRQSSLSPEPARNDNGSFNGGFYTYYPTAELAAAAGRPAVAHTLAPNADKGALIRSGEGTSYSRVHLTKIDYQDANNATSPQTWTFEFDVQPAQ
ncbi:MAG: HmuY family protein [Lautropia sp.]|nr:HmuY family protein [Lautropia sp.]